MIAPMLADSMNYDDLPKYISDDSWVVEQKLDGHRVIVSWDGTNRPVARTRGGSLYTRGLPKHITDFRLADYVLDGELVGAPASKNHPTRTNEYWVFDIIQMAGQSVTHLDVATRRALLETLFAQVPNLPFRLVPQAATAEEKRALIQTAVQNNLEGVVVKHTKSTYHFGARSKQWLKAKLVTTAEVVIIGVRDDGKDSAALGIWDGSSFKAVGRCSLIGKPEVKIGDVVEIRYLYIGTGGRLYQPTLMRVRRDKQPVDCTGYEFKYVNKAVLATL